MENDICNNGSFKKEGKERDECPTSSRLCLLTRIDAHVETSITRGLDSTFLEKMSTSDLLWINSGSPGFPVIGNSGTISCRKRRPRNARSQSTDWMSNQMLESKRWITFLLEYWNQREVLPFCCFCFPCVLSQFTHSQLHSLKNEIKTDYLMLLPELPCSDMLCILWMFI